MKKMILCTLMGIAASTQVYAGTYSIVGGSMSAAPTSGAYAYAPASGNHWQVEYGSAASSFSPLTGLPDTGGIISSASPTYTWRVRWVRSFVGDPPPTKVWAEARAQGSTWAKVRLNWFNASGGNVSGQVTSSGVPSLTSFAGLTNPTPAAPGGNWDEETSGGFVDIPDLLMETGLFVEVSTGVWEADMTQTLIASTALSWYNVPSPITWTTIALDGYSHRKVRPVIIDGQTIAPDF